MDKWVIRNNILPEDNNEPESSESAKKWKPAYEVTRNTTAVGRELMGKWLTRYTWLRVEYTGDGGPQLCYCKWCSDTKRSNSFTKGVCVTKADVLNKHEKIEDHKFAQISFVSDEPAKSWKAAVVNANTKAATAVKAVMNIVYFQCKENIATRKIKSLKELCFDLGADNLKDLEVDKHTNYESYDAVHDMEDAMASLIKNNILHRIKDSSWYSVCIDESTDVSVTQSVIIYLKSVCKGQLTTDFLQLQSLIGSTADDIYTAVSNVLTTFNIDFNRISSVGSDGASVMVGCRNGVATKFKQHNSYMIPIHCVAHRLALASGQAADTIPYLLKFQEVMNKTFKYFEYSAKRTRTLHAMQSVLEQADKKFVQIFHTRWLSFFGALEALNCNWVALVSLLIQDKSAVGQGLLKSMTSYKFLACSAFLTDVLYILNQLCLTFQKQDLNLNTVLSQVEACVAELKSISETHTGTKYMAFLDEVPKTATPEGFDYRDHHVRDNESMRKECKSIFTLFMQHIINNIEERLGSMGQISKFIFLLPSSIPDITSPNFSTYGDDELTQVCEHFKDHDSLGNHSKLSAEWKLIKRILVVRCKSMKLRELVKFLDDQSMKDLYPLMVSLYEFILSLPMATVDCERGFSVMNLTKTSLRNRLTIPHLSTVMMISINGDDRRTFDFEEAFHIWSSNKARRALRHV